MQLRRGADDQVGSSTPLLNLDRLKNDSASTFIIVVTYAALYAITPSLPELFLAPRKVIPISLDIRLS
jgi:hypothetical protein